MSRPFVRSTLAAVTAAAFAMPGHAADEATVVVTATRQPARANQLIAGVAVIDRQQIEESPAQTLGELLGRQPGIQFNRTGGPGGAESVYIRGTNSDHALVLVDGVRVGSATLGTTAFEMIPLSQIERVEILSGPASALYGADALGGVIQIFTRGAGEPGTQAMAGAGNLGTFETSVSHQGVSGQWKYGISAGASGSRGINQIANPDSTFYSPDKDGYRNQNFAVNLAYRFDAGEAGVRYFSSETVNKYDTALWNPTILPFGGYVNADADWRMHHWVSGSSVWLRNDFSQAWKSTITVSQGVDDTRSTPSANWGEEADLFKTRSNQIVWQNDVTLPVGKLLLGAERLEQQVASTTAYPKTSRTISSLLAGWNGNIGRHSLQANLRRDSNSQFGDKTTHTFGYGYRLTDTLRIAATSGTAFKAPTFNQLYFPPTPGVGIGNANLVPESARSKEVRLAYGTGKVDASLAYFHNHIDNLINWGDAPAPYYLTPTNIGSATIGGWEAAANAAMGDWSAGGSVTLQNPVDDSTNKQLNHRAKRHGAVYLARQYQEWKLRVEATGASYSYDDLANSRKLGGYGLVNLYAERRLSPSLLAFGRVQNLFDKQYVVSRTFWDNSVYPGVGTTFLVGLRYEPAR
ncbi:MAG: TonB-dependent receptor domain-containing protein [Ignavibacteria bacterium]